MVNDPSVTRTGKYGSRITCKEKQGKVDVVIYEHTYEDMIMPAHPAPGAIANVGLSVSIGSSSDYGKQKIDIAAWCTLPCATDDSTIADTYQRCALITMDEVQRRLDEASERFFPNLEGGG